MSNINKSLVVLNLLVAGSFSLSQKSVHDSHDKERIIYGNDASYGQFPYFVAIEKEICQNSDSIRETDDNGNYLCDICGGSLIGDKWVLTAAHCVVESYMISVYMGTLFSDDCDIAYDVTNDKISIHPGYNTNDHEHDIALVKIPETNLCDTHNIVPLPKLVSSAQYPKYNNDYTVTCGFGKTETEDSSGRLQWARMKIIDNTECSEHLDGITKEIICASSLTDLASPSNGDSGGPLVLESTGELVGVTVASSKLDAGIGRPIMFARVTEYLEWIKDVSGVYY